VCIFVSMRKQTEHWIAVYPDQENDVDNFGLTTPSHIAELHLSKFEMRYTITTSENPEYASLWIAVLGGQRMTVDYSDNKRTITGLVVFPDTVCYRIDDEWIAEHGPAEAEMGGLLSAVIIMRKSSIPANMLIEKTRVELSSPAMKAITLKFL